MVSLLDPHGAVLSKNILPATARTTEWVRHSIDTDFAVSVLHSENIESTKDGAYSGMWQVHALSSVLKQCVVSIYPEVNQRYRAAFNRKCFPRELESNHPRHELLIMWTSTTNKNLSCKHWSPNHFVPCFVNAQATIKSQPFLPNTLLPRTGPQLVLTAGAYVSKSTPETSLTCSTKSTAEAPLSIAGIPLSLATDEASLTRPAKSTAGVPLSLATDEASLTRPAKSTAGVPLSLATDEASLTRPAKSTTGVPLSLATDEASLTRPAKSTTGVPLSLATDEASLTRPAKSTTGVPLSLATDEASLTRPAKSTAGVPLSLATDEASLTRPAKSTAGVPLPLATDEASLTRPAKSTAGVPLPLATDEASLTRPAKSTRGGSRKLNVGGFATTHADLFNVCACAVMPVLYSPAALHAYTARHREPPISR